MGMVANVKGLTTEELFINTPSLFQVQKHSSRSEKYNYISTYEILEGLRNEGYYPVLSQENNSKDESRKGFTKHIVRLRHINDLNHNKKDTHELIHVNSHDGSSSNLLSGGFYRQICSNGMIAFRETEQYSVRHQGKILDNIIDVAYKIIDEKSYVLGSIDTMKQISLNLDDKLLLAEKIVRFKDGIENQNQNLESKDLSILPQNLLLPRRKIDESNDLYTVMNVIQENLMRGGVDGNTKNKTKTKGIKSIDQSLRLNKAIYRTALEFVR